MKNVKISFKQIIICPLLVAFVLTSTITSPGIIKSISEHKSSTLSPSLMISEVTKEIKQVKSKFRKIEKPEEPGPTELPQTTAAEEGRVPIKFIGFEKPVEPGPTELPQTTAAEEGKVSIKFNKIEEPEEPSPTELPQTTAAEEGRVPIKFIGFEKPEDQPEAQPAQPAKSEESISVSSQVSTEELVEKAKQESKRILDLVEKLKDPEGNVISLKLFILQHAHPYIIGGIIIAVVSLAGWGLFPAWIAGLLAAYKAWIIMGVGGLITLYSGYLVNKFKRRTSEKISKRVQKISDIVGLLGGVSDASVSLSTSIDSLSVSIESGEVVLQDIFGESVVEVFKKITQALSKLKNLKQADKKGYAKNKAAVDRFENELRSLETSITLSATPATGIDALPVRTDTKETKTLQDPDMGQFYPEFERAEKAEMDDQERERRNKGILGEFKDSQGKSFHEKYLILLSLGRGGFGDVFLVEERGTGKKFVIKIIQYNAYGVREEEDDEAFEAFSKRKGSSTSEKEKKLSKKDIIQSIKRENQLLRDLKNKRIIKLHASSFTNSRYALVTEYFDTVTTLKDLVGKVDSVDSFYILREIARGLEFLHSKHVAHRDMKPANILIRPAEHNGYEIKIIDFGLAKEIAIQSLLQVSGLKGTWGYMSPEQKEEGEVGVSTDIYSLGLIAQKLTGGEYQQFLTGLLKKNPAARLTARRVVNIFTKAMLMAIGHKLENGSLDEKREALYKLYHLQKNEGILDQEFSRDIKVQLVKHLAGNNLDPEIVSYMRYLLFDNENYRDEAVIAQMKKQLKEQGIKILENHVFFNICMRVIPADIGNVLRHSIVSDKGYFQVLPIDVCKQAIYTIFELRKRKKIVQDNLESHELALIYYWVGKDVQTAMDLIKQVTNDNLRRGIVSYLLTNEKDIQEQEAIVLAYAGNFNAQDIGEIIRIVKSLKISNAADVLECLISDVLRKIPKPTLKILKKAFGVKKLIEIGLIKKREKPVKVKKQKKQDETGESWFVRRKRTSNMQGLRSANINTQRKAAKVLAGIGLAREDLQNIYQMLESVSLFERRGACIVLGELKDSTAADKIRALLNYSDEGVIIEAATALGDIKDIESADLLVGLIQRYGSASSSMRHSVSEAAKGALVDIGPEAIPALMKPYKHEQRIDRKLINRDIAKVCLWIWQRNPEPLITAMKQNPALFEFAHRILEQRDEDSAIKETTTIEPLAKILMDKLVNGEKVLGAGRLLTAMGREAVELIVNKYNEIEDWKLKEELALLVAYKANSTQDLIVLPILVDYLNHLYELRDREKLLVDEDASGWPYEEESVGAGVISGAELALTKALIRLLEKVSQEEHVQVMVKPYIADIAGILGTGLVENNKVAEALKAALLHIGPHAVDILIAVLPHVQTATDNGITGGSIAIEVLEEIEDPAQSIKVVYALLKFMDEMMGPGSGNQADTIRVEGIEFLNKLEAAIRNIAHRLFNHTPAIDGLENLCLRMLKSRNKDIQKSGSEYMAAISAGQRKKVLPEIRQLLQGNGQEIISIIELVGTMQDFGSVGKLLEYAKLDRSVKANRGLSYQAHSALMSIANSIQMTQNQDPGAVDALMQMLTSNNDTLMQMAQYALYQINTTYAVNAVYPLLKHEDPKLLIAAINILSHIGTKDKRFLSALPGLLKLKRNAPACMQALDAIDRLRINGHEVDENLYKLITHVKRSAEYIMARAVDTAKNVARADFVILAYKYLNDKQNAYNWRCQYIEETLDAIVLRVESTLRNSPKDHLDMNEISSILINISRLTAARLEQRDKAVALLKHIPKDSAIPELLERLNDNSYVVVEAKKVLVSFGSDAIAGLINLLGDDSRAKPAMEALADIGTNAAAAGMLNVLLNSEQPLNVRINALNVLMNINNGNILLEWKQLNQLADLLAHPNAQMRESAQRLLAKLGKSNSNVEQVLFTNFKDEKWSSQNNAGKHAFDILKQIAGHKTIAKLGEIQQQQRARTARAKQLKEQAPIKQERKPSVRRPKPQSPAMGFATLPGEKPDSIESLLFALDHANNDNDRITIIRKLGAKKDMRVIDKLVFALFNYRPQVQEAAKRALIQIGQQTQEYFNEKYDVERDLTPQQAAIVKYILSNIKMNTVRYLMKRACQLYNDNDIVDTAKQLLSFANEMAYNKTVLKIVFKALKDALESLHAKSRLWVGRMIINDVRKIENLALPWLIEQANNTAIDCNIRESIINALEEIASPKAIDVLEAIVVSPPNERLARAARKAIQTINQRHMQQSRPILQAIEAGEEIGRAA